MKEEKKVNFKMNLILQVSYQILSILVPLVSTPYVASIFTADYIGNYTYAVSISNYFVLFSMLGINVYASREIPKVRNDKELLNRKFSSLFLNKLILSIIAMLVYGIMLSTWEGIDKKLFIIVGISIFSCSIDLFWFFLGMERIRLTVTRNIIIKLLSLGLIFLFVKSEKDLGIYAMIISLSTLISNIYLWAYIFKVVKFVKITIKELLFDFKNLLILFIPSISVSLFRTMDKILLGSIGSMSQLGYYEQADKIMNVASLLLSAIGTVSVPRFSSIVNDDIKRKEYFYKYNILFASISCAIGFGLASISDPLAIVYLGKNYIESGILIFYLSICVIFVAIATTYRSAFLLPLRLDKFYTLSTIGAAAINIIADLIFIPFLGALGAVIGTILAEFVLMVIQVFGVRNHVNIKYYLKVYIIYGISGIIMFFSVRFLNSLLSIGVISLIIEIFAGAVVYLIFSSVITIIFEKDFYFYIKNMMIYYVRKIFKLKSKE